MALPTFKAERNVSAVSSSPPANRRGGLRRSYFIIAFVLVLSIFFYFSLPSPLFLSPTSFVIEDEKGELLSASTAKDGQWRFPASDSIPDKFAKCITAFEDKRYFFHPGIDPLALVRAVKLNLKSKI